MRECDMTQLELQSTKQNKRQTAKATAKKLKNGNALEEPNEPQADLQLTKTKTMNKKSRKTL